MLEKPLTWLFMSNDRKGGKGRLSDSGVQWVIRTARQKSGIQKYVTSHTLRHSYATHLLEMGLDIVSIKEALGHSEIRTTMMYLHISKVGRQTTFSPLDRVYNYSEKQS